MQVFNVLLVLSLLGILLNCNRPENSKSGYQQATTQELIEPLIEANKNAVRKEDILIDNYIERNKLEMELTGTGLRYHIYKKGTGEKAITGKYALIKYSVYLIDGKLCYSNEKTSPEEFLIGQSNKESGLHEGILYMRVGDKAKMILPSHLAHGLVGDDNKIPARSVIIYDVELLDLR